MNVFVFLVAALMTQPQGWIDPLADRQPEVLRQVQPVCPDSLLVNRYQRVIVAFEVDTLGRVQDLRVSQSHALPAVEEAVLAAVRQWEFRPGHAPDGRPVASTMAVPFLFARRGLVEVGLSPEMLVVGDGAPTQMEASISVKDTMRVQAWIDFPNEILVWGTLPRNWSSGPTASRLNWSGTLAPGDVVTARFSLRPRACAVDTIRGYVKISGAPDSLMGTASAVVCAAPKGCGVKCPEERSR